MLNAVIGRERDIFQRDIFHFTGLATNWRLARGGSNRFQVGAAESTRQEHATARWEKAFFKSRFQKRLKGNAPALPLQLRVKEN